MTMTIAKFRPLLAGAFLALAAATSPVLAAGGEPEPPRFTWSFGGPFGMYDRAQLQRGFQVFKEVCSSCHAAELLSFRNLSQRGGPEFTPAQAQVIASEWQHKVREIGDDGQPAERTPRLADRIPGPFPNKKAAETANGGKAPPDLSLMVKARTYERGFPRFVFDIFTTYQEQGADYMKAFLTGYKDPPAGVEPPPGASYNEYYPGHFVAMPNILQDGLVTYSDGTEATVKNYSADVTSFLMWAAEPHLEQRKRMGFQVILFLIVFASLLYYTKKRVWSNVEGHA
ncbi:MAG: cytochrome c1 [Alphaproteobacteria bacterium]